MKRVLVAVGVLATFLLVAAKPEEAIYGDGARLCFLGDSITKQAWWSRAVTDYLYTRFPSRRFAFCNAGVAGDTAGGCFSRLEEDVLAFRPTAVTVMFGMNDVGRGNYCAKPTPVQIDRRNQALVDYQANLLKVATLLKTGASGVTMSWFTPSPYDEAAKSARPCQIGCGGALARCAQITTQIAESRMEMLVDVFGPMDAFNQAQRKLDPDFTLCGDDRIHPREAGGLFMAATVLKAWNVPGEVSSVTIDAARCVCQEMSNATVTEMRRTREGFCFTVYEKALPWPIDPAAHAVAQVIDVAGTLNREMLTVKNLPRGNWQLSIDGKVVFTAAAQEFAKGINLSSCETPQMQQARDVVELNHRRVAREVDYRSLCGERWFLRRHVKDIDDWDEVVRVAKTFEGKEGFFEKNLPKYLEGWPKRGIIQAELSGFARRIETARVPQPHVYTLTRVIDAK